MQAAPEHPNEPERLKALIQYEVLDTDDEKAFDELTLLASEICGTPISLISLVDQDRQWFKSKVGIDALQTERSIAFCSHAILQDGLFEIENAKNDPRFHDNPLVSGELDIRFYAGMPLKTPEGMPIGTICVIDSTPHVLNDFQKRALCTLANQVVSQLETRLNAKKLKRINDERDKFYASVAHDLRSPFNGILNLTKLMSQNASKFTPERIVDLSSKILDASLSFYQVMDELLQWTSNQLNKDLLELHSVNVMEVFDHAILLIKESAEIKQISIRVDVEHGLTVEADKTLLKSIFRNLITNAIKYSPREGTVTLSAQRHRGKILLSVSDHGEGISDEIKKRIFSQKVSSSKGTSGELGNGMGLSLAGEFARRQHGRIWVDDQYTKGTKIVLQLAGQS